MDKNSSASVGDTNLIPGRGKSQVTEQLSPCATTTLCSGAQELQTLSPPATTTKAHRPRACAPQEEKPLQGRVAPPRHTRESSRKSTKKAQNSQK